MEFEKILDQYMDLKEINKKLLQDKLEEKEEQKNIKKNKKDREFVRTISMQEFVREYLGTEHDCENLKHIGLKSFDNPYVIGVSNNFALKNPDSVIRNEILVVIDSYGNPGTYINPKVLKNIETMEQYMITLNLLKKITIHNLNDIKRLYNEYIRVTNEIEKLQTEYINNVDLIRTLDAKNLLKKIKKFAREASNTSIDIEEKKEDISHNMNMQNKILNKLSDAIEKKEKYIEIDEMKEIDEDITYKVNRQKRFIVRNKRSIFRKDV